MNDDCGRGVFTPYKMISSGIRLDAIADLVNTQARKIIPAVSELLTRKGNCTDDNSSSSLLSMTEQLSTDEMEKYF